MIRAIAALAALLVGSSVGPWVPSAAAADGDRTVRFQDGQIRCLLSADFEGRGFPAAVCGRTDGKPFMVAPAKQNLSVVQGGGELYFIQGAIPGPESGDVVLGTGQTYSANGWTITTEELRALIYYDIGRHGVRINPVEVAPIWL
ncbi:hypothetical protein KXD97_08450 [Mycobacterium sp. SMC-8]|uniref:hypothetical protein n=1 Tax=Mycobacterium sp. SMC-8 TaxID=2857060 RepID=UPI0021B3CA7A|nr:hypothetical protein [Mycobacterium sp. SMC-8]UXA13795.1 hypothetical protein KXD97_08450 [Mycobacterium sp. SMC-8]